jgi:flagellar assembly protein FliH
MPENVKVRVIDSNAIMAEHMEPVRRVRPMPEKSADTEDGFVEGIAGNFDAGTVEVLSGEETIASAKEEAERILAEAKERAQAIIEDAREQADGIWAKAKQDGYQTGAMERMKELDEQKVQMEQKQRDSLQKLQQEYTEKQSSMEKELVEVILPVVEKVFHVQFDGQKEVLLHLVDNAILHIEGEKHFLIKVAESNVTFLEEHKGDILDRVGHDVELDVAVDPSMGADDCVIETDSGIFECSLGIQLENLTKEIKCLCS